LTRAETNKRIDNRKAKNAALVEEVIPNQLKVGDVQKVLHNLLRERVPIRDLETILETLGDWSGRTKDAEILTEYVRNALARAICAQYKDAAGVMHFPGIHPEATEWLVKERSVVGLAVDTLSLDPGNSKDFKTHYTWLPTGRWGIENIANLDKVPATGATSSRPRASRCSSPAASTAAATGASPPSPTPTTC